MTDTDPKPTTDTILSAITDKIASAVNDNAHTNAVVDVFSGREIDRRTKLLVAGFDELAIRKKSLDSVNKPDGKVYATAAKDDSGTPTYSDKRRQEIQKAEKSVKDLNDALNNIIAPAAGANIPALFDALEKATKKSGGDKQQSDE